MQTIGRYQLQEKLGQGGMGVVYRAFDSLIERVVAIKVISSPIEPNPEMRERFFREARAAGQLSHKNIITIHDLGEHEGQPYLAMEYPGRGGSAAAAAAPREDEPVEEAGSRDRDLRRARVRPQPRASSTAT